MDCQRKDGNTPLHHLRFLHDGTEWLENLNRFSKKSLRLMFQFYVDFGFDLRTRNDKGKTFWEFDGGRFPEHYYDVLKEFELI